MMSNPDIFTYLVLESDHTVRPATLQEFADQTADLESRIVGRRDTGKHVVSTVFFGGPTPFGPFETAIFPKSDIHGVALEAIESTFSAGYAEAIECHHKAVRRFLRKDMEIAVAPRTN
jgi:hypothetical protein